MSITIVVPDGTPSGTYTIGASGGGSPPTTGGPPPDPVVPPVASGDINKTIPWQHQAQYQEPNAGVAKFHYTMTSPEGRRVDFYFSNTDAPNPAKSGLLIDIKTPLDGVNGWLKVAELPGSDNLFRSGAVWVDGAMEIEVPASQQETGFTLPWHL